jgi:PHD/YefM family antitoxin component YafN of YafNO toxin-antitoxin module
LIPRGEYRTAVLHAAFTRPVAQSTLSRPAAVLISPDDLDSLEATLDVLSDTEAVRGLIEAEAAIAAGDVARGVDAMRALRRPTSR